MITSMKSSRVIFIKILLLGAVLLSLSVFLRSATLDLYPDYNTYYYGTVNLINTDNPYITTESMFAAFIYPPFSLIFFTPFTLFPYSVSENVFTFFSITCFFASIVILFKIFEIRILNIFGLVLIILLLNFFPVKFTLGMGQINNIILLLITLFLYFYLKTKDELAGIFLSIALSLKIFPILLIAFLIRSKRWKIIFSIILSIIALYTISYFYVGHTTFFYFFETTLPSIIGSQADAYYNQSFSAFLNRAIDNPLLTRFILIISGIILFSTSIIAILKQKNADTFLELLCISNLIILNLIFNSIAWQHHYVWTIIPLLATLFYIKQNRINMKYVTILALSFLLIAINLKDPQAFPVLIRSHALYGAVILYCLQLYLLFQSQKDSKR